MMYLLNCILHNHKTIDLRKLDKLKKFYHYEEDSENKNKYYYYDGRNVRIHVTAYDGYNPYLWIVVIYDDVTVGTVYTDNLPWWTSYKQKYLPSVKITEEINSAIHNFVEEETKKYNDKKKAEKESHEEEIQHAHEVLEIK